MDVIIQLGHEIFYPPRPQFTTDHPNPLPGDPTTSSGRDVDGLMRKVDTSNGFAQVQSREDEVGTDDAALNCVALRASQGVERAVEVIMSAAGVTCV